MTVTSTVPLPGGAIAIRLVELLIVKLAFAVPKSTSVAPESPVPVIVTWVPPVLIPVVGLRLVVLVPPGPVTVTSTGPVVPAGAVAVIWVLLVAVNVVAGFAVPKLTAVAPPKPVPVIVTDVPPVAGPEVGLTPVTVGAGGGV